MEVIFALLLLIIIIVGSFLYHLIFWVPEEMCFIISRFGKMKRVTQPGLRFKIPFIENIKQKIDIKERVLEITSLELISKDGANIVIEGTFHYVLTDPIKAASAVDELNKAVFGAIINVITKKVEGAEVDQLMVQRRRLGDTIKKDVTLETQKWGVEISYVALAKFELPQEIIDSIMRKIETEREKQMLIAKAEAEREAELIKAEGRKRLAIIEAEGRKESAIIEAEAEQIKNTSKEK